MSVSIQREVRIIPDINDTVTNLELLQTSEPIKGTLNLAAVPALTSLSFANQNITKIFNLDLNVSLKHFDISNNVNLSSSFDEINLLNKQLHYFNVSNTQCVGNIQVLTQLENIEFFHAANTMLNGNIVLPPTLKSLNLKNCNINGTFTALANIPELVELDCSNNILNGNIVVTAAPKLTSLKINNNNFGRVINRTNIALLSNIKVFDISNNNLANTVEGLTDVYTWIAYFKRLKLDFNLGGPDYVLNLSGTNMPALSNANIGNVNLLISEDYNVLTSSPNPWTVIMGSKPVRESQQSIARATTIARADQEVRDYIRNWERTKNEVIPTRDIQLVDRKVKQLKTVVPEITGSGISTLISSNQWLSGSMWDLVGLNFEPDPDHDNYIKDFLGGNTLLSKPTSLIYYLELLWFIKTMKWLGYWDSILVWPLKIYQYRNLYSGSDLSFVKIKALGGGGVNKVHSGSKAPGAGHILNFYYGTSARPETNQFTVQSLSAGGGMPLSRGSISVPGFRPVTASLTPALTWENGFFFYASLYTPAQLTFNEILDSRDGQTNFTPVGRRSFLTPAVNDSPLVTSLTPTVNNAPRYQSQRNLPTTSGRRVFIISHPHRPNLHSMRFRKSDHWERDRNTYKNGLLNWDWWESRGDPNFYEWPVRGQGWMNYLQYVKVQNTNRAELSSWKPLWVFENNVTGQVTTAVNDPYFNDNLTVPQPYYDDVTTTFDWTRRGPLYGYTNWRDIRVSYISGNNTFNNEDSLHIKFFNPGTYNTGALPVTELSYKYKNFWVNIDSYNASTRTIRVSSSWSKPRLGYITGTNDQFATEIRIFNAQTNSYHNGKVQSIDRNIESSWAGKIVDIVLQTDVIGQNINVPGSQVLIGTPSLNEEGGTFIREWDSMSNLTWYVGNNVDANFFRNRSLPRNATDSLSPGGDAAGGGYPHRAGEYIDQTRSAEDFLTPHFVFNNTLSSLNNTISSVYMCGRFLGNFSNFSNFTDVRPLIDNIRLNNPGPIYGTLVIENSANGAGMVFNVLDIIPEKRYRHIKTRVANLKSVSAPVDNYYTYFAGFGTDRTAFMSLASAGDLQFYGGEPDPPGLTISRSVYRNDWNGQVTLYSDRDPIQNVQFNSISATLDHRNAYEDRGGAGAFSFSNLFGDRYNANNPHDCDRLSGYCRFLMLGTTSFSDLCANNFLKANTMHKAITSFFLETSGFDLTPRIGTSQGVDFVITEPDFGVD